MLNKIHFRAILNLSLSLVMLSTLSCTREQRLLQSPVVQVNEHKLEAQDFSSQLARRLKEFDSVSAKDADQVKAVKDQIVRDFIIQSLTREWAEKNKIIVTREEVEKELESLRKKYPDDYSLRRMLTQENISFKELESSIESLLYKKKVTDRLTSTVKDPPEEEIKKFYEANKDQFYRPDRVKLRQVVLSKESEAESIKKRLSEGAKISELAEKFSIAPERENKGETDWIEKGVLDVFDKAFEMRAGTISPIIQSPFGFHVFEVMDKQQSGTTTYEQARPRIVEMIRSQKEKAMFARWLDEQIRASRVLKNDSLIAAIKVETRTK